MDTQQKRNQIRSNHKRNEYHERSNYAVYMYEVLIFINTLITIDRRGYFEARAREREREQKNRVFCVKTAQRETYLLSYLIQETTTYD